MIQSKVHSIDELKQMLDDPLVQMMAVIKSYFIRFFTKYFSETTEELPQWYLELLFSDDSEVELVLGSCVFLFEKKPECEDQLRNTDLRGTGFEILKMPVSKI